MVTGRATGHPVRVIKNQLAREFQRLEKINASPEEYEKIGKGSLYRAAKEGDMEMGSIMAGQIAGLVQKEQSCKEIIEEIFIQAEKIIKEKCLSLRENKILQRGF